MSTSLTGLRGRNSKVEEAGLCFGWKIALWNQKGGGRAPEGPCPTKAKLRQQCHPSVVGTEGTASSKRKGCVTPAQSVRIVGGRFCTQLWKFLFSVPTSASHSAQAEFVSVRLRNFVCSACWVIFSSSTIPLSILPTAFISSTAKNFSLYLVNSVCMCCSSQAEGMKVNTKMRAWGAFQENRNGQLFLSFPSEGNKVSIFWQETL